MQDLEELVKVWCPGVTCMRLSFGEYAVITADGQLLSTAFTKRRAWKKAHKQLVTHGEGLKFYKGFDITDIRNPKPPRIFLYAAVAVGIIYIAAIFAAIIHTAFH